VVLIDAQDWQHALRESAIAAGAAAALLNAKTPNPNDIGVDVGELEIPEPPALPVDESVSLDRPAAVRS